MNPGIWVTPTRSLEKLFVKPFRKNGVLKKDNSSIAFDNIWECYQENEPEIGQVLL